ncbi:MAG TPA: hypothetical protein VMF08_20200 [Candidatus Sulfotelmatobacter sp.]|nr:hypothetical protein [Candidatus Sulfotelmatobacter sp.]
MQLPLTTHDKDNDGVKILADSAQAKDYHEFLKRHGVICTPPKEATWVGRGFYVDQFGRERIKYEVDYYEISADLTMEKWNEMNNEWMDAQPLS